MPRRAGAMNGNDAINAYREALKERTRERVPVQWAVTQSDIGVALAKLGACERGTERIKEAGRGRVPRSAERTVPRERSTWSWPPRRVCPRLAWEPTHRFNSRRLHRLGGGWRGGDGLLS